MAVVDLQPLLPWDVEPVGIQSQLMQGGGVNVGDIMAILDRVKAQFVCCSVNDATLDPAACHPASESGPAG